jgi:hypothetical protein
MICFFRQLSKIEKQRIVHLRHYWHTFQKTQTKINNIAICSV